MVGSGPVDAIREHGVLTVGTETLELGLMPQAGGSWTSLRVRSGYSWLDVLRPATPAVLRAGDRLGFANWPLVPFSNRIANGELNCFPGRPVRLPANAPAVSAHAIHGHGWLRPWTVEAIDDRSVLMVLDSQPDASWPWRHRVEQSVAVVGSGVEAWLRLTNLDQHPMPAGIGWHTYFPRTPQCSITARCQGVWQATEQGIPTSRRTVPAHWDLSCGARLADLPPIDNCFTGWDGCVRISWPEVDLAVELSADPSLLGHAVFYNPAGADFFCFEPVSHATNAPNLPPDAAAAAGLRILAPGETLAGRIRLTVL